MKVKIFKTIALFFLIGCMKAASAGIYYQGYAFLNLDLGSGMYNLKCISNTGQCCYVSGFYIEIYHWSGTISGNLMEAMPSSGGFPPNGVMFQTNANPTADE